ncbi:hypothetical protein CDD82_7329 [Ophiocordyceps australis]|uniref:GPI-anchored wall transfer protein n=1 Tax=Ophiocordyceps australis TaxID=1399860 RepID=A0A2C5YRH8_9HYPO|nr:hypothetical protein CDD82_7329 [Ophiocordyceps australis]
MDAVAHKTMSYKQQKEDFVSNLAGGSVSEINYIAVLLWSALQTRLSFFNPSSPLGFAVDYVLNVGAILLATTLYSSMTTRLVLLLLAPLALLCLAENGARRTKTKIPPAADSRRMPPSRPQQDALPIKSFLTTYRGCMMVVTCVAILAVDFRLFPRRFAKVETWGTSFMDMGVGSFVFAGGVVAARPILKERASGHGIPLFRRLLYSARHSVPLLVLGVIRMLSVKGLDYAEHVTEYGVHWNFFFTLGLLPPFVATCQATFSLLPSYSALALLVAGSYQLLLEMTSLKAFILTAPRTSLIAMNREGIFSFFGYLAIFLAGLDVGLVAIPRIVHTQGRLDAPWQRKRLLVVMAVCAAGWSTLYCLATGYPYGLNLGVSRRLANLPYVLWVAAFNSWQLLAFCAIDTLFFAQTTSASGSVSEREAHDFATSRILRAYNRNGLAIFLVANLATGLVNMTLRTLDSTPVQTMAILVAYTLTLTGIALVLDAYEISIKL